MALTSTIRRRIFGQKFDARLSALRVAVTTMPATGVFPRISSAQEPDDGPDIVMILADDLDCKAVGSHWMPNCSKLAQAATLLNLSATAEIPLHHS